MAKAMLDTLRSIVQEVNSAIDLRSAMDIVVERVQQTLGVNACAIYQVSSNQKHFVLRAARGLNPESIGKVRLKMNEGLVGLVGARAEPLNMEEASLHPNFQYFPETGEERYHAFLGVPILHHRNVLGVLIIQDKVQRQFDEQVESFVLTLAAQLAVVLAHANVTGAMRVTQQSGKKRHVTFEGGAGAPGVAVGQAVVVYPLADLDAVPDKTIDTIDEELQLFHQAVRNVKRDIRAVSIKLSSNLGVEERALFDVYMQILDDRALAGEVVELIRQGSWAQGALRNVIETHVKAFNLMDDPYLRERASDIRDLGRRILAYLQETQRERREFPDHTILVGEELTPADLGAVPKGKLAGLVSLSGSRNSHIAILARAMEVPTVVGIDIPYRQMDGIELIVDGYQGKIFPNPPPELRAHFEAVIREEKAMEKGLEALADLPAQTLDNHRVPLRVNTGLLSDVARSIERGAEGVGLYRTEVPFMMTDRFPSEKQQREFYRDQLQAFAPHPVTMRTLDVGGDKELPYFPIEEENPFLGWRGIRITLDHPEIFLVQVRAMLEASAGFDNLRIMLPMISNVTEVEEALQYIHQAYYEVREEGFDIIMPAVGVMVEVPSAVYQARELAQRVDFLSVGSNDLTQYLLAVDRNNSNVADLYHSFHPAVLKALRSVVNHAHLENKPVSICGELAGDPAGAILLLAMGYDELSMNASNILRVKAAIRSVTMKRAQELLEQVLQIDTAEGIQACLAQAIAAIGLETIDTRIH